MVLELRRLTGFDGVVARIVRTGSYFVDVDLAYW